MALLEIKNLTTKVSGFTILDGLDLAVDANELRVLLGPNGAGKTTLIAMITGQFKPTAGRIVFDGRDITGRPAHEVFRAGVSRKFQVPNVYETLSVYENVMISLRGNRQVFKYIWKRMVPEEVDRVWEILEFIELDDKARHAADTLSHGERQWLEIGMLVAAKPKLLLLDEPTTGMTEEGKQRTAELIRRIATNHTVILVEHDMHLVRQIARKVTVMHQGRVLAEGSLAEVVANETVRAVYLGTRGRH